MGRRRRRRGGFFRRIGRAFSKVGRAIGGAIKGVASIPGKLIGAVTGRRRGGGGSSSPAPVTPTSVGPQTNATNLGSHTRSRSSLSSNPVYIKAGEKRTAVAPTTIKLEGQDLESAIDIFGGVDKEYGAFEKPPLPKVPNLDGEVSWGHMDLPSVFLDWAEFNTQDEKDRINFYKIMEWVPAKEGDENVNAPRNPVLTPLGWYEKNIESSDEREKDSLSDRKPKRRRRRSENKGRGELDLSSTMNFSRFNNVVHGGRYAEGRIGRGRHEPEASYKKRVAKWRAAGKHRKKMESMGFMYSHKTGRYVSASVSKHWLRRRYKIKRSRYNDKWKSEFRQKLGKYAKYHKKWGI